MMKHQKKRTNLRPSRYPLTEGRAVKFSPSVPRKRGKEIRFPPLAGRAVKFFAVQECKRAFALLGIRKNFCSRARHASIQKRETENLTALGEQGGT